MSLSLSLPGLHSSSSLQIASIDSNGLWWRDSCESDKCSLPYVSQTRLFVLSIGVFDDQNPNVTYSAVVLAISSWRSTASFSEIGRRIWLKIGIGVTLMHTGIHKTTECLISSWRRSRVGRTLVSAGELSLSYARLLAGRMITLCVRRPLSVSQMANSAIHPPGVSKWVVIHN